MFRRILFPDYSGLKCATDSGEKCATYFPHNKTHKAFLRKTEGILVQSGHCFRGNKKGTNDCQHLFFPVVFRLDSTRIPFPGPFYFPHTFSAGVHSGISCSWGRRSSRSPSDGRSYPGWRGWRWDPPGTPASPLLRCWK
jgi:hypothetical protein